MNGNCSRSKGQRSRSQSHAQEIYAVKGFSIGGRVRIFNGNQWETLSLITQERIGVGASNLVGIIDVGVDACGILSRSVRQTNRK